MTSTSLCRGSSSSSWTGRARRSTSASARLLDELLQRYLRLALDRTKFWNVSSQCDSASTASRNYSRRQLELEAEHREHIKSLRRRLRTPGTRPRSEAELLRYVEEATLRAQESATRTTILRHFVSCGVPEKLSDWLTSHKSQSTLYASLSEASTASGKTS